ncbi:MAG: hypothetical protein AAGF72_00835 [Pseudomonadota bacterium]
MLSTLLSACEKWSWPPYEKSLRELFADSKDRFEEIRLNMQADNLEVVDSAYARGRSLRCDGANCPATIGEHDEELQAKYSNLIEELSSFRYGLFDGDFNVSLSSIPDTQGGEFYFDFVRSEKDVPVPHCDEEKARLPICGACYESLDPNWYMYWRWFPQNLGPDWDGRLGVGLPTREEIEEQANMALDECLKAGWEEMGLSSDAE